MSDDVKRVQMRTSGVCSVRGELRCGREYDLPAAVADAYVASGQAVYAAAPVAEQPAPQRRRGGPRGSSETAAIVPGAEKR